MVNIVLFIILILIVTLAIVSYSKNFFIYQPVRYDEKTYQQFNKQLLEFVDEKNINNLKIETDKNIILDSWYLKHPHRKNIFLFCHGNGGNITNRITILKFLYKYGSIIIYDYRGYGNSSGCALWSQCHQHQYDLQVLITKYQTEFNISSKNIILVGESLGCSLAIWLGGIKNYRGIFLLSPFLSLEAMMKHVLHNASPWLFVLNDSSGKSFASNEWIKKISKDVPIIIMHSKEDEIIPYQQAIDLAKLHPNSKLVTITGTHNDPVINDEVIYEIDKLSR